MGVHGWVASALGIVLTCALAITLMVLVFHSMARPGPLAPRLLRGFAIAAHEFQGCIQQRRIRRQSGRRAGDGSATSSRAACLSCVRFTLHFTYSML
jgi:hypothetical protein